MNFEDYQGRLRKSWPPMSTLSRTKVPKKDRPSLTTSLRPLSVEDKTYTSRKGSS